MSRTYRVGILVCDLQLRVTRKCDDAMERDSVVSCMVICDGIRGILGDEKV